MCSHEEFSASVRGICNETAALLIAKNRAYGNSALDPVRIFSQADPQEQIRVRIDDKLSRIMRGSELGEDTINDLIGYLIILKAASRIAAGVETVKASENLSPYSDSELD
jgi:hypothetical protein